MLVFMDCVLRYGKSSKIIREVTCKPTIDACSDSVHIITNQLILLVQHESVTYIESKLYYIDNVYTRKVILQCLGTIRSALFSYVHIFYEDLLSSANQITSIGRNLK